MSKVNFEDWSELCAKQAEPVEINLSIGDKKLTVEVKPRLTHSEWVELGASILAACRAYQNTMQVEVPPPMYLECILRWFVLDYYTNLDLTDERVDMDAVWAFAGQRDIWYAITEPIQDYLADLSYEVIDALTERPVDKLADEVLALVGRVKRTVPEDWMDKLDEILDMMNEEGIGVDNLVSLDEKREAEE